MIISSCQSGPIKPDIRICVLDVVDQTARCGLTGPNSIEDKVEELNGKGIIYRASILSLDRNVCFSPKGFQGLMDYLHELEMGQE